MTIRSNRMRSFAVAALVLALRAPAWAQQNAETPAGGQDLAPAGGLTVQEGAATTPTACPNGSAPSVAASDSSSSFENSSLSSVMYSSVPSSMASSTASSQEPAGDVTCPGASDTTVNNGTDASDTTTASSAPAMK